MAALLFLAGLVLTGPDERHLNRETLWNADSTDYYYNKFNRAILASEMMWNRSLKMAVAFTLASQLMPLVPSHAQADDSRRAVRLIQQRCVKCHGGDLVNAGIDFSCSDAAKVVQVSCVRQTLSPLQK